MSTHTNTNMGSVNIAIRDEAYQFLKSMMKKDESFSDVILKLKGKKGNKENVMRLFGALKDEDIDWEVKEKRMKEFRDSVEKRIEQTTKYMEETRKKK